MTDTATSVGVRTPAERLAEMNAAKAAKKKAARAAAKAAKAEREAPVPLTPEQAQAKVIARKAAIADADAANHARRRPEVDPQDISISAARKGASRARVVRRTLGVPVGAKPAAQLAAEAQARALAPRPKNAIQKGPRVKMGDNPYQPSAKPSVADPLGQIIYGNVAPDVAGDVRRAPQGALRLRARRALINLSQRARCPLRLRLQWPFLVTHIRRVPATDFLRQIAKMRRGALQHALAPGMCPFNEDLTPRDICSVEGL